MENNTRTNIYKQNLINPFVQSMLSEQFLPEILKKYDLNIGHIIFLNQGIPCFPNTNDPILQQSGQIQVFLIFVSNASVPKRIGIGSMVVINHCAY